MSRIDEIKERTTRYRNIDQWRSDIKLAEENNTEILEATSDFDLNCQSDIEYLLSRLEIAEKALEEAEESICGLDRNVYLERGGDTNEYYEGDYIIKVREALKQLRS